MCNIYSKIFLSWFIISSAIGFYTVNFSYALDPDEVVVVANAKVAESLRLAEFYMAERTIPENNLIVLSTDTKESCSRDIFQKQIETPIRRYLQDYRPPGRIRCLVLMYGLPYRVNPLKTDAVTRRLIGSLQQDIKELEKSLQSGDDQDPGKKDMIEKELSALKRRRQALNGTQTQASVDSELMLVMVEDYPTGGWIPNPYFFGAMRAKHTYSKDDVLMVSRLDGPTMEIVRRIVKDAMETEKTGLSGRAYFDARWPKPEDIRKPSGYKLYDLAIHRAAETVEKSGRMPVVLEHTEDLFQPGQAPDAALYCGWYSLGRYVDAFTWKPGAVGYHIASRECRTLKKKGSQVWCKRMLEEGVAATIGPVGEPYVSGFPLPNVFFGLLLDGYLTLAECYLVSLPHLSWKMVLIGDPLYRPFKH